MAGLRTLIVADIQLAAARDVCGLPGGLSDPSVTVFEDREFEGATGTTLAEACASDGDVRGYVVVADARSMQEAASGAVLTGRPIRTPVRDAPWALCSSTHSRRVAVSSDEPTTSCLP
jgi:hypothetical protein